MSISADIIAMCLDDVLDPWHQALGKGGIQVAATFANAMVIKACELCTVGLQCGEIIYMLRNYLPY